MIINNREFFSTPYYFFLKETKDKYYLYFSVEETLTEARKKDEVISVPKGKMKELKKYLSKVLKTKKKASTKELKGELEELVNADGGMSSSRIPILNPVLHPKKTMDQTICMARITNDPLTRGYRTYFGESEVEEIDMSKAFGYDETEDLPAKQTIKKLKKMGVSDPVGRAEELGKDPKLNKKKLPDADMRIRLVEKEKLEEVQKQKMIKVLEDILMRKKLYGSEINEKEPKTSPIVLKNLKTLKKQAEKEGLTIPELIKMLKSE